jgi:hypothetical protein
VNSALVSNLFCTIERVELLLTPNNEVRVLCEGLGNPKGVEEGRLTLFFLRTSTKTLTGDLVLAIVEG